MLLGIVITRNIMLVGGGAVFTLLVFQVLEGKRKIKFKGPLHQRVHRRTAYVMTGVAVLHALTALAYLNVI